MEWLVFFLLRNLRLARWMGWWIFCIAGAAVGFGLRLGRVFNRAARAFQRAGLEQDLTLAKLYPDLPTWWIPESGEGFAVWIFIGAAGAGLAFAAKSLQRQI